MLHFISNYTKNQTLFGKRKNFVIIPNTSHFEPLVSVLKSTQKNSSIINILIVRSIEDRARIDLVLQVAELLKDDQYMFTIAGKGPLLTYYQKEIIAKKLTNVEMLGYVDDTSLLQLYADCDLVMMPAEYGEGFGLPIIEGYLFNKPVIASNRCAIPEIIISKDYLFENTKESIQIAIKSYMTNKSFYFKQYYDSHFSNSLILSKFRQLYCN
jgi:glycosyltransferase involved in cell wall biosynthesis